MSSTNNTYAQRRHMIVDMPFIGPLLLFLYGDLAVMAIQGICSEIFQVPVFYVVSILGCIPLVIIHRFWFRNEYRGGLCTKALNDKRFWTVFLILVAFDTALCIYSMIVDGYIGITAEGLTGAIMAGVGEEISDRYIVVSAMMRRYKKTGNYVPVLLLSSILFGLSHYINIDTSADFWPVTLQVIITCCSGIAMGAVFIRTGNIMISIVWHTLHDILCSMAAEVTATDTILEGVSKADLILCAVMAIGYVGFAIIMLKGQKENIKKIWNDRWPEA